MRQEDSSPNPRWGNLIVQIGYVSEFPLDAGILCGPLRRLLPKFLPSFSWFLEGVVTKGFGKKALFDTARTAMGRRKCPWTEVEEAMWIEIFNITAPTRSEAVKKGRRVLARSNQP